MKPILISTFALALFATGAAAETPQPWMSAWIAPPIGYEPKIKDALGRPFNNETTRQSMFVNTSGNRLRLRLSNELGDTSLNIGAASIARLDTQGDVIPGSVVPLTFAGSASVAIPPHAPFYSDELALDVKAGEQFAISLYYPDEAAPAAHAQMVWLASGNATGAETLPDAKRVRVSGLASALEVSGGQATRGLVTFGDSITEGAGATQSKQMSWPDQLAKMLNATPEGRCWAVSNAGISGNRLLHDGRGPDALSRLDRDVLTVAGANYMVVLEGINDIGESTKPETVGQEVTAEQIIATYEQILVRAHAHGIKVIMGTLLPYEGAAYASPRGEVKRETVNAWIRANTVRFDGLIDFDAAMHDETNPKIIRPAEHIGDFLHPNDAGYSRMAQTALLALRKDACS